MQGTTALTFTTQGDRVIAGFTDGRIAVFNRLGREQARFAAHDGTITALAISSDDKVLVTGSEDSTIVQHRQGDEQAIHRKRIQDLARRAIVKR